jgi:cyclopropane fatty-acyl-phospholipid synthase-like methyltransferase
VNIDPYRDRYEFEGGEQDAIHFVGAFEEFERKSQPEFMKAHGLEPQHKFLDLACGCLRGTIDLINYLHPGNFYGADVSDGLIRIGYERAMAMDHKPTLRVMDSFDLSKIFDEKFDFILSVSFLTHILPPDIPAVFKGVASVLAKGGKWFFTIYPSEYTPGMGSIECHFYNKDWLISEGRKAGLLIKDIPGDFENPCPNPHNLIKRVNSTLGQWVMEAETP